MSDRIIELAEENSRFSVEEHGQSGHVAHAPSALHEPGLLEKIDYTRMDKADIENLDPRVPMHPYGVPNMVL